MRCLFFLSLLLFPLCVSAGKAPFTDPKLQTLLDSGDYFQFRSAFQNFLVTKADADPVATLYYGAWQHHLFLRADRSNECIDELLVNHADACTDEVKAELLQLRLQNDFRSFQYRSADSICNVLLFQYATVMKPAELADVKNFAGIAQGLKDVPPQTLERNGALDVKYKRDMAHLIKVPVSMHGEEEGFLFDTGANLSTISESEAKRMGLKMINTSFGVESSSKSDVGAQLGLAEELKIGNAVFRNVIFIVFPDKALRFAGGLYKIKGIIGIPVIMQLGEVQIHKNGHLTSPVEQTYSAMKNLGMNGNTPFAEISFYGVAHPYIFDTGAGATVLNPRFYSLYKDSLTDVKEKDTKVGGAGGVQEIKTLRASNVPYTFGGKSSKLKMGMIQLSDPSKVYSTFYGIAGQDIYMPWETMVINFEQQFVLLM